MQKTKKWIAGVLTLAMVGSSLVTAPEAQAKKKTKGFTISKVAGTYNGKVTVKVKAKKGYMVYYTTGKKLSTGKKSNPKRRKHLHLRKQKHFVFMQ